MIGEIIGHIEEKSGSEYLVFDLADETKDMLKKSNELWDGIKDKIEITNDNVCKYGTDFTKVKFDIDDKLPLNK